MIQKQKFVIIVAGGSGSRMGSETPKQFLTLAGKPILQHTIEKFVHALPEIKIITVLPKDQIEYWKEYCIKKSFHYPQIIVKGGITRFHSVKNALEKIPDGAVVAVHDGVRPFVSEELIRKSFSECSEEKPAVIPVVPAIDTLRFLQHNEQKNILENVPDKPLDRKNVYAVQTPQLFLSEILKESYNLPFDTSFTDDASVVERKEIPLSFIEGERFNIKITTPDDLRFEFLLSNSDLTLKGLVK